MDSDEIEFSPSDLNRSGGKADVAKATIRLDGGTEEELVAVKKHRYFQRIDKKKFANVRAITSVIDRATLMNSSRNLLTKWR